MMNYLLNHIFYPAVGTRLHVAGIYYFVCCRIVEIFTPHQPYIPVIISFTIWHYALYLFDRAYDANLDNRNHPSESLKGKYTRALIIVSVALAFLPMAILSFTHQPIFPFLFFLPVTFLYNLRIFPGNRAIKHFTLVKNLYSAILIWPLPVSVILKYYVGLPNYLPEIFLWFWSFVIYVLVAEIIWDMRDVDGDRSEGLRTIPVVFGLSKTRIGLLVFVSVFFIPLLIWTGQLDPLVLGFFLLYILISSPSLPKWLFHIPLFLSLFVYAWQYFSKFPS